MDDIAPYEGNFTIDASGHYEVYAVVSDDDGNDITSTVQRSRQYRRRTEEYGRGPALGTPQTTYLGETAYLQLYIPSGAYDPTFLLRFM